MMIHILPQSNFSAFETKKDPWPQQPGALISSDSWYDYESQRQPQSSPFPQLYGLDGLGKNLKNPKYCYANTVAAV